MLTAALAAGALATTVAAHAAPWGEPARPTWVLVVFLVALTLAGCLNLEYHYRGQVVAVDLFEAVLAPAVFTLRPLDVVVLAVSAKAASQAMRRVAPGKAAFNVAQWGLAAAAGSLTFTTLAGAGGRTADDVPALVLAMLVVVGVTLAALVVVMTVLQDRGRRHWLVTAAPRLARDAALPSGVNLVWGLLFTATWSWAPAAAPLFVVPLGLLYWANRGYALGRVEQARLEGLHRATTALSSSPDPRVAVPRFLAAVSSGFGWEAVELVLPGDGGREVHRHRAGQQPEYERTWQPAERRTAAAELLATAAIPGRPVRVDGRAATGELARRAATEGWRELIAAGLWRDDEAVGLLCVYDRSGAMTFLDHELTSVAALADEAAGALERAALHRRVHEEQATLARVVEDTADGIVTVGRDGAVHSWNPAFARITGYTAAEVRARGLALLRPTDAAGRPVCIDACGGAVPPPEEIAVRTRTGERRWLSCSYSRTAAGGRRREERLVLVARDVTAVRRHHRVRDAERAVFECIAAQEPLPHVLHALAEVLAPRGSGLACGVLLAEEAAAPPRVVACTDADLFAAVERGVAGAPAGEATLEGLTAVAAGHATGGSWVQPVTALEGAETIGAVAVLATRADVGADPDAELMERAAHLVAIAVWRSVSEARLAHQATYDGVTGLPNRVVFLDRCQHALDRARRDGGPVAVIFVDLDRFKMVNDSLGHDAGDRLLLAVGQRLVRVLRPGDTVARFGGDEFTILCDGSADDVLVLGLAQRIQSALAAPFPLGDSELFVTASLGIATSRGHASAESLVGDADAAMYRAKERGGHRFELFDDAMRRRARDRMAIQNAMHRGLERGEFEVHYQPVVSLDDQHLRGAEALLRWRHPQRGLLAPAEYIGLAETSGLIVPIGEHVLRTACRQAREWQRDPRPGRPIRMSINLSARQFIQPDLTAMVASALEDSGVDPPTISLEITETAAMDDADATAAVMRELTRLGVGLTIDDFGTGYSSLTYLKRFPVNGLKVDRSFVTGLVHDEEDAAIVAAVIDLAHSMSLVAVAEGVETAEQLERLRALGCDAAQGFHLGRPQPAGSF